MVEKALGKRIQEFRKKKKLTQEQLAELIHLSPNHLSAIERGVYGVKLDMLVDIMNYLDCSADDLFCDVVKSGYQVKASRLSDRLEGLSIEEQQKIFDVVDTMVKNAKHK